MTNKHRGLSIADTKIIFVYEETNNNTTVYGVPTYICVCIEMEIKMRYNIITNLGNNVRNIIRFGIWCRYTRG